MIKEESITVSFEINFSNLDKYLWGGAAERWNDANENIRENVWERISDLINDSGFISITTLNDTIWFDCDDLFYPEEDQ